ncbi:hypothetical protein [Desemzia sp. FAM 23991]|uniref:hypothetical protein n=1 Tax=Desemzia sp. FAM 23991 TaxID=3259521 RepID=UPI003889AA34
MIIKVTEDMKKEALEYSQLSKEFTSRRHDHHEGGSENAALKMYEGKIGEKAFRFWLDYNNIPYQEDETSHDSADFYDFLIKGYKIDVKTRTKSFHTRILERVEQFEKKPKDIYVSAHYYTDIEEVKLIGVISANRLKKLNPPESFGYEMNYFAHDYQLSSMETFKSTFKKY